MKRKKPIADIPWILKELEYNDGTFPRSALQEAIANRQEITPALLDIIKDAKENVQRLINDDRYMAHIYAIYLLAQFREKRAYPLITDFFSIPGEITLDLTGSMVTEALGRILASVSHGDTSLMKSLAEDPNANGYVRNAGLRGLVTLWVEGAQSRDELMDYFQHLFRGGLERDHSYVWTGLVNCSTDLYPEEVLDDIEQAFKDDLIIDNFVLDWDWVLKWMDLGSEKVLDDTRRDRHYTYIGDTVKEMEWWACFDKPAQPQAVTGKVGRNKPCPCGSGKKFKWCCGAKS
jgi:hypothetical protein